jgi:GDP-L-fucose synthase
MKKILITGAKGLVGNALQGLNRSEAIYLSRDDVDLTNFELVKNKFKEISPDKVIHLAAQVGGIGGNLIHSGEYFRNNILINTNVLEAARLSGCNELISYMSTCVFPDKCEYPLNEKSLHNGPPHPSNFGYAYAKRMLEVQSTAYRKEWGCNYIVAIPTNIYGPGDNFSLTEGHVVPALIHRMYLAKKNGESLEVWGTGKPLREFVYSVDIARLSFWAIDNYREETPIIFTSGIEVSIAEMVHMVAKKMDFNGRIVFNSEKPDGQYRKPSDGTKLNSYLPEFQWTPLEEGIEKTILWFEKNFNNLRK